MSNDLAKDWGGLPSLQSMVGHLNSTINVTPKSSGASYSQEATKQVANGQNSSRLGNNSPNTTQSGGVDSEIFKRFIASRKVPQPAPSAKPEAVTAKPSEVSENNSASSNFMDELLDGLGASKTETKPVEEQATQEVAQSNASTEKPKIDISDSIRQSVEQFASTAKAQGLDPEAVVKFRSELGDDFYIEQYKAHMANQNGGNSQSTDESSASSIKTGEVANYGGSITDIHDQGGSKIETESTTKNALGIDPSKYVY